MEDCNATDTPIAKTCLMDANEVGQQVDSTKCRGLDIKEPINFSLSRLLSVR